MESKIVPLSEKAKAILPDSVSLHVELHSLGFLSLQLLVLIAHLWRRRSFQIADIPRSKRTVDCFTFTVKLRVLNAHLKPGFGNRDYRYLRAAIKELSKFQVEELRRTLTGKEDEKVIHLFDYDWSEDRSEVIFTLSWHFAEALQMLDEQMVDFTKIPVADALALSASSHLLMLFLASKVRGFYVSDRRTKPVWWLRDYFGLTDSYYDQPRYVLHKLEDIARIVSAKTSFRIKLIGVRDEHNARRLAEVQFDVNRPRPTIRKRPNGPHIKKPPLLKELHERLAEDEERHSYRPLPGECNDE